MFRRLLARLFGGRARSRLTFGSMVLQAGRDGIRAEVQAYRLPPRLSGPDVHPRPLTGSDTGTCDGKLRAIWTNPRWAGHSAGMVGPLDLALIEADEAARAAFQQADDYWRNQGDCS